MRFATFCRLQMLFTKGEAIITETCLRQSIYPLVVTRW